MTTYYVRKDGSDSNNGLTDTNLGAFLTIGKACSVLVNGVSSDVYVRQGTYYERVTPTISGTSGAHFTFYGETDGSGNPLTFIDGSSTISGAWTATTDHGMTGSGAYENSTVSAMGCLWEATNLQLINQIDPVGMNGNLMPSDGSYTQYTGPQLLALGANFVHPYSLAPVWNGIEASWGYASNDGKAYLRYRNGDNPSTKNLRWSPGPNSGQAGIPSTGALHLSGVSYYTWNNFVFQGAYCGVFFNGSSAICQGNIISGGIIRGCHVRTYFYGRANSNIVRNLTMRSRLIGLVAYPVAKSRISGVGYDVDTNTTFNVYAYDKFYWGQTTEQDASARFNDTATHQPTGNEIANCLIFEGCQAMNMGGDGNGGGDGTLIHHNTIYQHASQAIYIQPVSSTFNSPSNWEIYDNYFWRNTHVIRTNNFHVDIGNCSFRNNRCEDVDGYGTFVTFYKAAATSTNYLSDIWFTHNSFKGGNTIFEYGGVDSGTGAPDWRFVNNIYFTADRTISYNYTFDFENTQARIEAWAHNTKRGSHQYLATPAWYDAGNANITTLWDTSVIDGDFDVTGTAAEQSGLDLSQPFTIRGTSYPALSSWYSSGYFTGVAPNRGALQDAPAPPGGSISSATPTTIAVGGTVTVSWQDVTTPLDWIALSIVGTPNTSNVDWNYTSSETKIAGGSTQATGSMDFVMNFPAGTYEFRLFYNDGFSLLDTSDTITVTTSGSGTTPGSGDIIAF